MTRVFWTFLIAEILFLAPNFIWGYVLAFVKSRNEILHYDLMLGKFGSLMDYLLFLAPTLFTAIVYTVLLLSWKNQNQLQISREANKESL